MPQKLYVGNLPYRTTEDDLRKLFNKYGPVYSLILIYDKETSRSLGYAFVELDESKIRDALCDLGDTDFNGRKIKIDLATGRNTNKAPEKKTLDKNASEKNALAKKAQERRKENKPPATPRGRQTMDTEYIVSDINNYG